MSDGFVKVARVADLAVGKMMRVAVGRRRILLANVEGHFYAVDDTCTHEDASLATGSLRGAFVKCPLHGSRFDLRTGQAMEEPAQVDLQTYAVRVRDESIFVELKETVTR